MLCAITFSWIWAGHDDSPLTNRIWQNWWDVTYKIRLQKDWLPSWVPSLFPLLPLPCSERSQVSYCEYPYVEAQLARNACVWPTANEDLKSAHSQVTVLLVGSSLSQALRWLKSQTIPWLQPCETLSQRRQLSCTLISDPQKLWANTCLLFWAAKVWGDLLYSPILTPPILGWIGCPRCTYCFLQSSIYHSSS